MKKILLAFFTLAICAINVNAQGPPDFGFENPWGAIGGNAQGWASAKLFYPNVVIRDTVIYHFGGTSAKVTTTDVSLVAGQTNGLLPPISGIILSGIINPSATPPVQLGYPFSQRKDSLGFFARYQPTGVDTAFAQVIFYKRQSVAPFKRDTIAQGLTKINATNGTFNLHYVEMLYNPSFINTTLPDSALIVFSSSTRVGGQIGSTLWVDDLKWGTINTGITETIQNENIKLSPNPADEFVTINFGNSKAIKQFEILDLNGKLIESFTVNSKTETIGVGHLNNGLYFYTVRDKNSSIITAGKFTVKH